MSKLTIYHNPRCSKSRQTLQIIQDHGLEPEVVLYLETAPDVKTLRNLGNYLGLRPQQWLRKKEDAVKAANIDLNNDDSVYALMAKEPKVIERPIVVKGKRAIIGRPPENVLELLN